MIKFDKTKHKHGLVLIIILFVVGILYGLSYTLDFTPEKKPIFGVTFSQQYAKSLNLDWKETFIALLDEMNIREFRLSAYWNEIEKTDDYFDFKDLDWQIQEVRKRNGKITLAVGRRLPRWPECHVPDWAKSLNEKQQQEKVLEMIPEVIEKYKNEPAINRWQVENEPLLPFFGECPKPDLEFLKKEIEIVRSLDTRPILVTASGEFGDWSGTGQLGDVLGVSLYRIIWKPFFNYISYPISPAVYYWRQNYALNNGVEEIILSELQTEPWTEKSPVTSTVQEQYKSMNPELFKENIEYALAGGFSEIYVWGGEWWYWLKTQKNLPEMWEVAKELRD